MPCGDDRRPAPSIHCPYHGWRYGLDGTLLSTPRFDAPAGFDQSRARPRHRSRSRSGTAGSMVNVVGHGGAAATASSPASRPRVADHEPERLVVGGTHSLRAGGELEAARRELPGVLPLPEHPSRAVRGEPADERREPHRARGMWVGGWQDLMPHADDDVAHGRQRRRGCCRGLDESPGARIDYLGLLPNLLVSLHPDYVMTHRLEPLAPDRTAVECQWLFAPEAAATATASTRRSPSTSGTSPTARTGRRARRAAGCRVAWVPARPVRRRRGRRRQLRPPDRPRLPRRLAAHLMKFRRL